MQERIAQFDSSTGLETAPIPMAENVAAAIGPDIHNPARVTVSKLRVLHDYLVVRPLAVPSRKQGGLIELPGTSSERERSHRGVVLITGPGDFNEPGTARVPMSIHIGDLVFFGKYSGTEEEIGGGTVLVMRESECRMSVPAGDFQVVEHDNGKLDHLVEDWCEVCHGVPLEEAAKERLAFEREQLLAGKRPADDAPPLDPADAPTLEDVNERIAEENFTRKANAPETPFVTAGPLDRRPCAGGDCLFMQQKFETATGPIWFGIRCGHWHQALTL